MVTCGHLPKGCVILSPYFLSVGGDCHITADLGLFVMMEVFLGAPIMAYRAERTAALLSSARPDNTPVWRVPGEQCEALVIAVACRNSAST